VGFILEQEIAPSPEGVFIQRLRRHWSRDVIIILFLLPSVALFFLFVVFPVIQAAHYSLYQWSGLGSLDNYIGLKNYQALFKDPIFLTALKNNILIAVLSLLIQLPAALLLALLINRKMPGRTFFRTVFFLPYVLAPVVTGLIWSFIYNPSNGLIAGLLRQFNPGATPPAYLADTHTVLFAIFAAICWQYFGFHFVLYVAGLQNIPAELIEAARIDGASSRQTTFYVTLPLLGSTIRLSVFLSILGSLQYFDLIYVMSDGGPVNASETMATYQIHYGLQQFALGYGSAVGVIMFGLCLVFALLYQRVIMRQDLTGASAL